jgi:glycosyltransferase involved in cell wall biosynthesis
MIEAMACGTPVIAYNRGSVPEIIEHGVTGFVVESEAEALEAIGRLRELDRREIRRCFERRFTSKRMAQDYTRIYDRIGARYPTVRMPKGPMMGGHSIISVEAEAVLSQA